MHPFRHRDRTDLVTCGAAVRVHLLATGGTIASRHTDAGVVASASGAELLSGLPHRLLSADVQVSTSDVGIRGSYAFTLDDMKAIADAVVDACESGADAVVVTHGTDSMEETAFLTELLHEGDQPVIFTGAQRPFDDPDGDGLRNLALAVATAADPSRRGTGVLVVFADLVLPAVGVRKVSTERLAAFGNPLRDRPDPERRGSLKGASMALAHQNLAPVSVVAAAPGGDGTAVRDACSHGPRGLVLQALGIGNASLADAQAVAEATTAGIPVLVTSRVQEGPVKPVYGNGGGKALEDAGAVFAGQLSTWQARILLSVCLTLSTTTGLDLAVSWIRRQATPH
ncbi:asparaginase [Pedococcus sp. NPDC057267]|uniref:asparaginase n=1 Tax=Pedococcus sp. NPDC057267 TaxID=3346077 RepID=UPI003636E03A